MAEEKDGDIVESTAGNYLQKGVPQAKQAARTIRNKMVVLCRSKRGM